MAIPDIGAPAPDFTLPGTVMRAGERHDDAFSLSGQIGRPVVLAFYPSDASPVCTSQLCSYEDDLHAFVETGAVVWGISPQGLDSHAGFARGSSLHFPLLADTEGRVIRDYGIQAPLVGVRRSVFLIGPDGVVRWRHVGLVGVRFPAASTIRRNIEALVA
ncbi:peroxiredoxin [Curtobacterium sp. RRHDQ10]|uniref:peroxiredoxin n=1 Tax=Curtobacterium phyllosphaerae TaxID=3413379 RepID=UPI003BF2E13E